MKFLQIFTYLFLQIILLPLTFFGVIRVFYVQFFKNKRLGLSAMAVEVMNNRWIHHIYGTRRDDVTVALLRSIPNASYWGLFMSFLPFVLAYKLVGFRPNFSFLGTPEKAGISQLVSVRTLFFDSIIEKTFSEMGQVVFLGAGYDTRALNLYNNKEVQIYELDQAETQIAKKNALRDAGYNLDGIAFVEVNFQDTSWMHKLIEHGFDRNKKTLFIWEGVTLYLNESDIYNTLDGVAGLSTQGSIMTFDIYSDSFVSGTYSPLMKYAKRFQKHTKEDFSFGIPMSDSGMSDFKKKVSQYDFEVLNVQLVGEQTKYGAFAGLFELRKRELVLL